jgi:hypothetical protein
MTKFAGGILATGIIASGLTASSLAQRGSEQSARSASPAGRALPGIRIAPAHTPSIMSVQDQKALVGEYCLGCHDRGSAKGELVLEQFDVAHPEQNASIAEKVIRKLRAGMMPPPGEERPEPGTIAAFAAALETRIDQLAAANPNPGRRTFQRLNRAEYGHSIREILGLDVDVAAFLPPDTISHNFDNIADVQTFSPTLLEGYLRAATRISRDAVGDPAASPSSSTYRVARTASQLRHVEGAPFGTRGGISVVHTFPADGEYTFRMMLHSIPTGQLYGSTLRGDRELLEVSIEGERVAVIEINPRMSEADPNGMNVQTPPVAVKAGPHRVSAAFVQRWVGPVDDVMAPIEHTLADTQIGSATGITTLPHLRDLAILGPQNVTGVSDTPVRRRIFTCRPTSSGDETACATKIVSELARRAYRRPITPDDLKGLMRFYHEARQEGDFESGIRTALQAILASPHFIFRLEEAPAGLKVGENYRIAGLDLASRLSFFLWSTPPDDELLAAAAKNGLQNPAVVEKQVRRMLADARASALATRFGSQWLRLQDLEKLHPEPLLYPQYDRTLAEAMVRETELFFESLVREDRSVLELLSADYTFVNERLARHYGLANVVGDRFQRVSLAGDPNRRGLLGQASILAMTSVADRTSPVLRGKWVLEVLFGMPPPPPPDDVPDLEATKGSEGARLLSVRERLEAHRKSKACQSCHRVIDPLGLALENFDVTGAWRIRDNGTPVDPSGQLYDGTPLDSPAALRDALLKRSDVVLKTFSENLMAYALGRRIEPHDMPTIRAFVKEAAANGNKFSAFVLGVVRSPAFQMARADVACDVPGAKCDGPAGSPSGRTSSQSSRR